MLEIKPDKNGNFPILKNGHYRVALGNGSAYDVWLEQPNEENDNYLYIGIIGVGVYCFCGFATWDYVQDKIHITNESDCKNITDFINSQISKNNLRFGRYDYIK